MSRCEHARQLLTQQEVRYRNFGLVVWSKDAATMGGGGTLDPAHPGGFKRSHILAITGSPRVIAKKERKSSISRARPAASLYGNRPFEGGKLFDWDPPRGSFFSKTICLGENSFNFGLESMDGRICLIRF